MWCFIVGTEEVMRLKYSTVVIYKQAAPILYPNEQLALEAQKSLVFWYLVRGIHGEVVVVALGAKLTFCFHTQ